MAVPYLDLAAAPAPHFEVDEPYWFDDPESVAAVDAVLLTKALEYITAHPEEWNQCCWVRYRPGCGTTACLAGTTVVLAGYDIDWTRGHQKHPNGTVVAGLTTDGTAIEDRARMLLGLHPDAAEYLFHYYGDDLGALWRRAAVVSGGRVEVPSEFAR